MPLKTDTIEEPGINLTPMVDVVFLLIIFFMVGSRFTEIERQYNINLPTVADAQPLTSLPDAITINVLGDGGIVVNGEELSLTELETKLVEARQNYADQAVVIRGPGPDPYQHVIDVLAVCHKAKIASVGLAYRLQSGNGE